MARKSGFVRRNNVMRRETIWLGIDDTTNTLSTASTAALILSFNAAALALRPFTIVRTRLNFFAESDQDAAAERYLVTLGAAVVSDEAVAIGVTAIPTPQTEAGSDLWFLYETIIGRFGGATATGETGRSLQVDSKAMRKVEDGQDVVFVIETGSISAGAIASQSGRMLLKLH